MIHISPFRSAIAMIELIFALVIMGIVIMSAPMLISTATQSANVVLQQESIHEAVSRINIVMTYPWDDNDANTSCIPPVLHVTNGDSELNAATNHRRFGVPIGSNSRTFLCGNIELNASAIGSDGGDLDDIDDFGSTSSLVNLSGNGGQDYLENTTVQINTTIAYINDDATYGAPLVHYAPSTTLSSGLTSNIKRLTVTLTSTSAAKELNGKNITLQAFSCNIGGREFEKRVMP
ncbi:MAG: type II secretion system protein [Sulfurovum sp.]|nr:type II secretion system protein [Sulfurovum sp.]